MEPTKAQLAETLRYLCERQPLPPPSAWGTAEQMLATYDATAKEPDLDHEPFAQNVETSKKAAREVRNIRGRRLAVLLALRQAGGRGLTGWELCQIFRSLPEHAVRPRLTELARAGLAVRLDATRENGRGREEAIFLITSKGETYGRQEG